MKLLNQIARSARTVLVRAIFGALLLGIQILGAWFLDAEISDAAIGAFSAAILLATLGSGGAPDLVLRERQADWQMFTVAAVRALLLVTLASMLLGALRQDSLLIAAGVVGLGVGIARMAESQSRAQAKSLQALCFLYIPQIIAMACLMTLAAVGISWRFLAVASISAAGLAIAAGQAAPFKRLTRNHLIAWFLLGGRRTFATAFRTADVVLIALIGSPGLATTYALIQRVGLLYDTAAFGVVYDSLASFREAHAESRLRESLASTSRTARAISLVLSTVIVATTIVIHQFTGFVSTELLIAIGLYSLGQALFAATGPLTNALLVLGEDITLLGLAAGASAIQLLLIYLLTPEFGLVGAALSSMIALVATRGFALYRTARLLR